MAASDKKLQSFYAFNSGEYSKDLAGRTDLESFGSSTRYCSNFLSQISGGLKKFYGTRHITEQALTERACGQPAPMTCCGCLIRRHIM